MAFNFNDYVSYNKDTSVTWIHPKPCRVWITKHYNCYNALSVGHTLKTIGFFEFQVDGETESHGMCIAGQVEMIPSEINEVVHDGDECLEAVFNKGDVFLVTNNIIKNAVIAYYIFSEFVECGRIPKYVSYEQSAKLFVNFKEHAGTKLKCNHVVWELVFAHMARQANDTTKAYRLSDMKQPPSFLKLSDVPHATATLTGKLMGGYLNDSINVALINQNDQHSELEDILRQ